MATGAMVGRSLLAADELAQRGIHARVVEVHTIKPLDEPLLLQRISAASHRPMSEILLALPAEVTGPALAFPGIFGLLDLPFLPDRVLAGVLDDMVRQRG